MKNLLIAIFGMAVLAGCAYTQYEERTRYTQSGDDCVYYSATRGRRMAGDIRRIRNGEKRIYRNTRCADLHDRGVRTMHPAAYPVATCRL